MIIIGGDIIKKYPFVKQAGLKDCAVACTFMILKYYKGFVSMSKLEEILKTTRNGTTAYHIVEALKKLGFNAYGVRLEKLKETKRPFIASVTINSSYKHYIVVYEVNKKHILVADPADKIKKITKTDFLKIWTGVNIEMYPNKIITNEKPNTIKNLLKLINLNKKEVLKLGLISIVITTLSIITSFFFQGLIDNIDNLNKTIFLFITLLLLKVLIDHKRYKMLIKFTNSIEKNINKKIFQKIIKLPYRYYHNHTTGEVISKINDLNTFTDIIGKIILTCFINIPLTLLSASLLYYINKTLFKITLLIVMLYILILFIYHKKIKTNIDQTLENKADINSFMTESISGFETIKGINIENKIIKLFNQKYNTYITNTIKLDNVLNNQKFFKDIVDIISTSLILIIGINLVKEGIITLSTLITYNILSSFFLEPIKDIINLDFEIKEALSSLNRVLNLTIEEKEKPRRETNGDIEIKNLSFTLDDINYILKKVSLTIKQKNKVLITGKSGSGKSTLLKLIKGYYNDYNGTIKINNKANYNNKNIIYISSKETLFTGTINYNLTLKSSANLKKIKEICYTDEITNDSLGYNMLLEENGFNISNGQKQRLTLARALHNFDILLIDEGLSGLDINLERKILKKLFKTYKNKTIIIVSHRLDNLDLFDQYIKLENGKIILNTSKQERSNYETY